MRAPVGGGVPHPHNTLSDVVRAACVVHSCASPGAVVFGATDDIVAIDSATTFDHADAAKAARRMELPDWRRRGERLKLHLWRRRPITLGGDGSCLKGGHARARLLAAQVCLN